MSQLWEPQPGEVPPWVPVDQTPPAPVAPLVLPRTGGRTTPYGEKALTAEAEAVAGTLKGGRNHRLNVAAFALGRLVAGGEIDAGDAEEALADAAKACGLGAVEAARTIASGMSAGMREPRSAPERNGQRPTSAGRTSSTPQDTDTESSSPSYDPIAGDAYAEEPGPPAPQPVADHQSNPLLERLLDLNQLANLPQPEPLLTNVLDRRTITVLAGPWGTGKTLIALDWALCIASARFWLGEQVVRGGSVLYVAAEGAYGLSRRVAAWQAKWQQDIDPHLLQVLPDPVQLTDRRAVDQLTDVVVQLGSRLVVIDTVSRCMTGADENSAKDMSLVIDAGDRIRKATDDTSSLLLHHTGKDGITIRGSSALEGGADVVYQTSGDENTITLKRTKRKDGPRSRCDQLRVEPSADSVVVVGMGPAAQPSGRITDVEWSVWDRLGDVFKDQPASPTQLTDAVGAPRTTVYGALSRLVQRGLVRTVSGGRGAAYERMPGADPGLR